MKFLRNLIIIMCIGAGIYGAYTMVGQETIDNYIVKSRVFVTGNLHGKLDMEKLSLDSFPEQKELLADDNLIIVGDFGLIWDENIEDEMILDELATRNFKILFVDGAHENFDLLNKYEVVELYGGKAHKIRNNIFHLMRGEVYTISGKKYAVFGGGESIDKNYREKGISYWEEEIPSNEEWSNLLNNLNKYNNYVDYVLTYTPPSSDLRMIGAELGKNIGKGSEININLQSLSEKIKYKKWIHSYYHLDLELSRKHISVYSEIIELK